ncbi:MAG: hypothetical protein O3A10_14630 [Chloroflexi bacterium]|nr:hypothetical protein [Chloroflexota bacterium]MDA1147584.1 hypothetical protein [Chloroflexota bacterium]
MTPPATTTAQRHPRGRQPGGRGRRAPLLLTLLLLAALLAFAACRDDAAAGVGQTAEVGDADLTLVSFEVLEAGSYSALSNANARARVRVVNARGKSGEVYRFAPFAAFRLDDSTGVGRGPLICLACEDPADAVDLAVGAEISGWLYFRLEDGQRAEMLRYSAPLSRNRAEFALE